MYFSIYFYAYLLIYLFIDIIFIYLFEYIYIYLFIYSFIYFNISTIQLADSRYFFGGTQLRCFPFRGALGLLAKREQTMTGQNYSCSTADGASS